MTSILGVTWPGMDEEGEKSRREIRIPIPDLSAIKDKAAKASEKTQVSIGTSGRNNPLLATIITLALLALVKVIVQAMLRNH